MKFIIRSKENRKFEELESFINPENPTKWRSLGSIKNHKVKIFTRDSIKNKEGKSRKIESEFRLVIIKNRETSKEFWFLSNEFELSAKELSDCYKK